MDKKQMTIERTHRCKIEYSRHCLRCVAGDDDAVIRETLHDNNGAAIEAKIIYPEGSVLKLERGQDGWNVIGHHVRNDG